VPLDAITQVYAVLFVRKSCVACSDLGSEAEFMFDPRLGDFTPNGVGLNKRTYILRYHIGLTSGN